ncbi:MAG: oxidoreductase, partial [Bacteroidia bacterium]|nr:oxidoreductase [Bacteroidia bacterium]
MKTAIIVGASGLIGNQLVQNLIDNPALGKVLVLVRNELQIQSPKLIQLRVNFNQLSNLELPFTPTDAFCCLGTTIRTAGSQEAFKMVDYEYCVSFAQLVKTKGTNNFYLISSLGANANSKVFYNKVKGEVEAAIQTINFESYFIFRPSILLGNRKEFRLGEKIMKLIFAPISKVLFGSLKKYAAIESKTVALAMLNAAL